MHYADGTPAKLGDLILLNAKEQTYQQQKVLAIVTQVTAGSPSCNGQAVPLAIVYPHGDVWSAAPMIGASNPWCFTVGEANPLRMPIVPLAT